MEKRISKRKALSRPAKIYREDSTPICTCMVRDMSDSGARLSVKDDTVARSIPDNFILSFTAEEAALNENRSVFRKCHRVWANANQLGALFSSRRKVA